MNTLSDFKKALHPGVKLNTIWHNRFAGRDEQGNIIHTDEDCGIREVSIVQSNSFAFKHTKSDGKVVDSWCSYPKASECRITSPDTIVILEPDYRVRIGTQPLIPVLTYQFV